MRKQKVFNRVSAWLLVWTMVLSALAGNVTVRAEEPEEVDVQIEADTDMQTEEDADMQIEANQAPEDDQNGDGLNEYAGPTGLVAYTWLNWEEGDDEVRAVAGKGIEKDDKGNIVNEANPKKDPGADLRSTTWYMAEISDDGEEMPVTCDELTVEKYDNGNWSSVTANENICECSTEENVFADVDNKDAYIRIRFKELGYYHIHKTTNEVDEHNDEDDCIKVHVDYPFAGFYTKEGLSSQNYIDESYEYTEGRTIYAIIYEPEGHKVSLDGENGDRTPCGVSLDWGDNVREGVDYFVEPIDPENLSEYEGGNYYVYAITIAEDCQKNFALNVATQVTREEDGDSWPDSNHLDLNGPADGLHILWPWDEADEEMKDFNEIKDPSDKVCKATQDNLDGQHIYLCIKDGDDFSQITEDEDIGLFYKEGDSYINVTANKEEYGSIGLCQKEGHDDDKSGMFWFAPKKEGVYKISKGENDFVIWEVVLGGTYGDDPHKKAFSGCMLTETGYEAEDENGNIWEENRQPAAKYWAHGDTIQEVLDKLTGPVSVEVEYDEGEKTIVTIPNTGYYYIAMSCFTGNTDAEAKQKVEQTVTLSEDVKGVIMYSGQDEEVAWSSDEPDFAEGDFWNVFNVVIDGQEKTFCEIDDGDVASVGWHPVTQKDNGVYVYDKDKVEVINWNEENAPVPAKTAEYEWPTLVLDATNGHVPVKLGGKWAENAGVVIKYKDKDFSVEVVGKTITKKDAAQPVIVKEMKEDGSETENVITTVSFEHQHTQTEVRNKREATCTEAGYTGDTCCKDCEEKIKTGEVIKAIGHKWDAGKVTKPATETEKGVKTYTCQNGCGQTMTEEIPLLEKQLDPTPVQKPQGTKIPDSSGNTYKVTSDPQANEPTVEYTAPKKGAKGTVKVPDSVTVEGVVYKVTAIADNAFKGNKNLTKVTVGKNITSIGKNAFSGCTKLKTVTVGSNVTKIGDSAFKGCAAVTKITLPAKVEKIGKNAFDGCKKLKTITIKSTKLTAKNISKGAFKGVTTKTTIKVPKSKLKAYKALFQKKGLSKKVKVKA